MMYYDIVVLDYRQVNNFLRYVLLRLMLDRLTVLWWGADVQ